MSIESVSQAGLRGLQDSMARAQDAANRIAQGGTSSVQQVTDAVVDLKQAELDAAVSARVVEAGERMVGTLIDVLA